ncbi:hypothetical protein RV11_GL003210 [Enterococcus phoeniculicola]|uniref:Uncharacterized protein n=1 Tax=Enterococcus phoeniculicola ATCC BAA-412 TaxID=1158610 RepID=R3W5R1_9ENTE|nr:hypothetical protein [Enterococcus phoeniculicola]EOL42971.1 hypothetical protein UC3_01948 [Enterococcus phoeniculicola ATCC BAA-412]EOT76671.1 hypothetical protein I589_01628 [Enterococcus phoeniculicola ATCC BAA-412]OJG72239.1 hypothetical protein RV11_GL003210 [Enterococcus phoeniculicola]
MDKFDERAAIYEQMRLLIEERREISKMYFELKQQLNGIKEQQEKRTEPAEKTTRNRLAKESEYQQYMIEKNTTNSAVASYDHLSLKIASLLKEAGTPLSNKHIFDLLEMNISYKNLTHNILPRIAKDDNVNVNRAYRGFWQYYRK